jgi:ribosomal protein L7/L12
MSYPDPAQRLSDLELKVDGLVQLVEHLYHQLGVSAPGYQPGGSQSGGAAAYSPATDPEILQAIAAGNLIEAIKVYRKRTGVGLKEAKDAVEAMAGRR